MDDLVAIGAEAVGEEPLPPLWLVCTEPPDQVVIPDDPPPDNGSAPILIDCNPAGNCMVIGTPEFEDGSWVFGAGPACAGGCGVILPVADGPLIPVGLIVTLAILLAFGLILFLLIIVLLARRRREEEEETADEQP
jgi:hypothetical protein